MNVKNMRNYIQSRITDTVESRCQEAGTDPIVCDIIITNSFYCVEQRLKLFPRASVWGLIADCIDSP